MVNIAIIGTGNISSAHIEGYLKFKDRCKIVALVDIYPEKAEAIKAKFELDAVVYNSHEKLLSQDNIDLTSICTPPFTHAEIAIWCMENDMDVICEKPMAASLEEADLMIKARKETGKRVSIISQNRFRTPIMKLKKVLDSKIAGRVLHAQVDSLWWRGQAYFDLWWRGTWKKEGGGCTLNHAVHHIDMLCWMNGLPKEITAVLANLNHDNSEVEDFSVAIAKYENGSMSTLTSSLVHHGEEQVMSFQCEEAKVSAPWSVLASKSRSNGFGDKNKEKQDKIESFYQSIEALEYEGHCGQIDNVLTSIENDDNGYMVTAEDGRRTLEYITGIYKSGFTNSTIALPILKDDPYYTVEGILKNVKKFHEKSKSVENFEPSSITMGNDYSKYNYK